MEYRISKSCGQLVPVPRHEINIRHGGVDHPLGHLRFYVEDPGVIHVRNPAAESLLFWIAMYREGLIEGMESESFSLQAGMSREELQEIERRVLERG